ncbi:arginyl-tRNA synthetase, mitochondrial [Anticarsia gemmatalis]|uniref:arginyl-tRNA synthetase, mitochondrial n=1 Tax=Anticarsia gemmatalis TaxID=129554 RepID=UPI003F757E35
MKPKMMLINKILPHNVDRNIALRNLKNVQISYKHDENRFVVNVLNRLGQGTETKNNEQLQNGTFNVERNTFIRSVVKNVISPDFDTEVKPKKIVIDFSSPNIAKPFHAGHLRSTVIGNFISNLYSYFNNKVTKLNYLGDWGTQFGLLQYGLKVKNLDVNELKSNPLKTLYEVYVHANQLAATDENVRHEARKYFSDIEHGRTSLDNWKKIRQVTVEELEKVYDRLGIKFDTYLWESDYNGGIIKPVMEYLERENIIKQDETGKKVATINDRNVTVLKSDNSTMYLARDITGLLDKYKKYEYDKMLYVVENAQTAYFRDLFELMKQINKECVEGCEHIKFGRVRGMSTRTGNVVFLTDILDEAQRKMHEKQTQSKNTRSTAMNEETCDILGTTAVIINDLKQKRQKDYVFDWDRALQSEGDSGIKLQYLHCRLWSLERNCGVSLPDVCEPDHLSEEIIGDVIAEIAKFESVLHRSLDEYEACILVNYLFRLARHVNRMFNEIKVKNVDSDLAAQRLLVFHCARLVVRTGLDILGVRPLDKM